MGLRVQGLCVAIMDLGSNVKLGVGVQNLTFSGFSVMNGVISDHTAHI